MSLYWLLEEPTVFGARFDVSSEVAWVFLNAMCRARKVKLCHIIAAGCPELNNSQKVASCIGVRSTRLAGKLLDLLKQKLTVEEKSLLINYVEGKVVPDNKDPFPEVYIIPDFKGANGELLKSLEELTINEANSKTLYRSCVKILTPKVLNGRVDTVWRDKLGLDQSITPVWRVFYKLPLEKKVGDLQWRILHVHVINPTVCNLCPFMIKARVWVDFKFYKMMKDLIFFSVQWCHNEAICSVVDELLLFFLFITMIDVNVNFV